jgi:hypothetical protein
MGNVFREFPGNDNVIPTFPGNCISRSRRNPKLCSTMEGKKPQKLFARVISGNSVGTIIQQLAEAHSGWQAGRQAGRQTSSSHSGHCTALGRLVWSFAAKSKGGSSWLTDWLTRPFAQEITFSCPPMIRWLLRTPRSACRSQKARPRLMAISERMRVGGRLLLPTVTVAKKKDRIGKGERASELY